MIQTGENDTFSHYIVQFHRTFLKLAQLLNASRQVGGGLYNFRL